MEDARNIDNIDRPQGLEVTVSRSINTRASNSDQVWNRKAILICLLACSPHLVYHQILFILPQEGVWNQLAFITTVPLLTQPGTTATVSDCPPPPAQLVSPLDPHSSEGDLWKCKQNHTAPFLKTLQWLPIFYKTKYKLLPLAPEDQHDSAPASHFKVTPHYPGWWWLPQALATRRVPPSPPLPPPLLSHFLRSPEVTRQSLTLLSLLPPAPQFQPKYRWSSGLRCDFLREPLPTWRRSPNPHGLRTLFFSHSISL